MKFTPYYAGKHHGATFDTVKDYLIKNIQKNYKYGNDLARRLEPEDGVDYTDKDKFTTECEIEITKLENPKEATEYDMIEYKEAIREWNERWRTYQDNKIKS